MTPVWGIIMCPREVLTFNWVVVSAVELRKWKTKVKRWIESWSILQTLMHRDEQSKILRLKLGSVTQPCEWASMSYNWCRWQVSLPQATLAKRVRKVLVKKVPPKVYSLCLSDQKHLEVSFRSSLGLQHGFHWFLAHPLKKHSIEKKNPLPPP